MKILIENEEVAVEKANTLRLTRSWNGDVVVEDEDGWHIVGFKAVNGKISIVRYSGVGKENFNVDEDGIIEEVGE